MSDIINQKMASRIQNALNHLFFYEASDKRARTFSVTEVMLNYSKTTATVYIESNDEKLMRKQLLQWLNRNTTISFCRSYLSKELNWKHLPNLYFKYDDYADKMKLF